MKKHSANSKKRMCDPGLCDHCIYLGEGDFACDSHDYVIVVEDFVPTDNYLICEKEGKHNDDRDQD